MGSGTPASCVQRWAPRMLPQTQVGLRLCAEQGDGWRRFRLNGPLTITGKGKDFVDIIVASYLANLEWRKHNNKIWQIIIWTAA